MTDKSQTELSRAALEAKQADQDQPYLRHQQPTPDQGAVRAPNPDAPVDGAFDAEGHRPVLERSRKVR